MNLDFQVNTLLSILRLSEGKKLIADSFNHYLWHFRMRMTMIQEARVL